MEETAVGPMLRRWRTARRLSQQDLALEAEVSSRHLSFVETGRARPSREMVLLLASALEVPLRERNALLQAAGFAPAYHETGLDEPAMSGMLEAVLVILRRSEPSLSIAVDRHWDLVIANGTYAAFLGRLLGPSVPPVPAYTVLPEPRFNTMVPLFDPAGFRSHLVNWGDVARTMMLRLRREAALDGDRRTRELLDRLTAFPGVRELMREPEPVGPHALVVPVEIRFAGALLRFVSTITTLGAPQDITLAELRIESFYPADADTERALASLLEGEPPRLLLE
jgi:transcriptional regulator with XRE-family HTH domain